MHNSRSVYRKFLKNVKDENELGEIAAVVNLNYDTTFDDSNVVQYYHPGDGQPAKEKIPLIRPHGSLKWTSRSGWRQGWTGWSESYDGTSLNDMGYKPTGDPMLLEFRQPLIVPPAYFKEEVIGNSSMPGLQNLILRQQWRHLIQSLKDCNHWVFVGISFASGDDHLLWLLKSSYREDKTQISCFIKDNCQPVQKLKKCLGNGVNITVYKIKNENEKIDEFKKSEDFNKCELKCVKTH